MITNPYTIAEIRNKIASNDYSAELMLQHVMIRYGELESLVTAGMDLETKLHNECQENEKLQAKVKELERKCDDITTIHLDRAKMQDTRIKELEEQVRGGRSVSLR